MDTLVIKRYLLYIDSEVLFIKQKGGYMRDILYVPQRVCVALFAICVIFIAEREVADMIRDSWHLDKVAHFLVSFSLAVIFLWVTSLRYHGNTAKAKKAAFLLALIFGILWEVWEAAAIFSGAATFGWDYGVDTLFDLIADATGALWYLMSDFFRFDDESSL
jgi:hypothetical protein